MEPVQVNLQPQHGLFIRTIKSAVAVMTFIVLASVIGTCVLCGKAAHDVAEHSSARRVAEERVVATATPIDISASELEAAYRNNEVSADNLYRGHVLRVAGVVKRISKDILDDPHVILRSEEMFGGITCSFGDSGDAALTGLTPGLRVVLRGVGAGYFMGGPMLRGCVIDAAVGPSCRVPNADVMGGGTAMGECKDVSNCTAPSVYYQGFCEGPTSIVCCVVPPPPAPPSSKLSSSPPKRLTGVRPKTVQQESDAPVSPDDRPQRSAPVEAPPPETLDCSTAIKNPRDKDCVVKFCGSHDNDDRCHLE